MAALTSDTVPIVWIKDIYKFVYVHVISIFSEGDLYFKLILLSKKKINNDKWTRHSKLIAMPI